MTIEKLNTDLSAAKERVFGDLKSEGGGRTSGAYSLASGCAALLIALYGLQSEIALSVAKAAEHKAALAKDIQKKLDDKKKEMDAEQGSLTSSDTKTKEDANIRFQKLSTDYDSISLKGQTDQDNLSVSSNVLQGYMSQQSQGMQSFIEFMKIINSQGPFIANLLR
ncbi:MAG: hypothetical protein JSR58_06855 [Verrucomicrobia bacterium]|nr:hypothetical protein [Verrucomicrobiota bacterium]